MSTIILSYQLASLYEERPQPTPKAYGPVRAIFTKNPESRSPALGLNKRIPGIRYK
ncbi:MULTISPECIES: hypothetical protein [unclassified Microcoleus]|uniref:hypothetical protein n=1 Tax=unclassified Microcoleus TaxID=2642155 RepID=UPI002FCF2EED